MPFHPLPPHLRDAYEAQAEACLAEAERYHDLLLAKARRLAGSHEAGWDIYCEACLRCHDTIQRKGFSGDGYRWYLLATIRNLHYERSGQPRPLPLPAGWEPIATEPADCNPYQQLAEQVAAEARARFTNSERVWLRLHADGYSAQEIALLTGASDRYQVRHALDRMKAQLRELFQLNWQALLNSNENAPAGWSGRFAVIKQHTCEWRELSGFLLL